MSLIDGTPSLGDFLSLAIFILVIVQVFTPADPIVASLRLIKHLRSQVSSFYPLNNMCISVCESNTH